MGQPQRRDPRQAKELDYARHRRSAAEYPHAWRRLRPRKKAIVQRAFRRGSAEALRSARGRIEENLADQAAADLDDIQRQAVVAWPSPTLGEHVRRVIDNRVERMAYNHFKHSYDSARHRLPFARFLGALTAGRRGQSVAGAQRFARILATPPAPVSAAPGEYSTYAAGCHRWLLSFFADEPEWRQRLDDWIDDLTSGLEPDDQDRS